MATKLPPIPSPPGTAFREFRITMMPALTFALVLGATVLTWRNYVGASGLVGEAESVRTLVASSQAGRVEQLHVAVFDRVFAGQPVAQIRTADPRVLDAQLALSKARIDLVRLSVDPKLRTENNRINYQQLRLDWMVQRADLGVARARLAYFETEFERTRQLYGAPPPSAATNTATPAHTLLRARPGAPPAPLEPARGRLVSVAEYELAQSNVNATRAQVEELARLVAEMEVAMKEFEPEEASIEENEPNSIRAAVAVEERLLTLVEAQLAPVTLTAPIDGFVSGVHRRPGETVVAGDSILTISQANPEHIIAYIRQPLRMEFRTNQPVEVRARSLDRATGVGQILAVGTQLEPVSAQLLLKAQGTNPELGLPILVSIPAGLRLRGGEVVDLRPVAEH